MLVKIYITKALCVCINYDMEFFYFCGIENKYLKLRYMQIFNRKNTKDVQSFKNTA